MQKTPVQIVWFKRDLRVHDHAALCAAAEVGPVLPLYVIEPDYWSLSDSSARHWRFVRGSLIELNTALAELGQPLIIREGSVTEVLADLASEFDIHGIWSHEETGNDWTFQRDKLVGHWCKTNGIPWREVPQNGVVRRLRSRNGWAARWDKTMSRAQLTAPMLRPVTIEPKSVPISPKSCYFSLDQGLEQTGGRAEGLNLLSSFLTTRGETYRSAMSNPIEGEYACSRLSPHLAWGTVSMKEAAQATWHAQRSATGKWKGSLSSFSGRLHWHCHFIQKLEDEPRLEWQNLHPAYDGLRPSEPDQARLDAWRNGETGLPFVDACMRYLAATGWLNFRMRAMVASVAAYHLWLDWRAPGLHLARMFTDYEPGIHWSQIQMQSGTTGINTVRIYNPIKQGLDQDPTGDFVRRWIPELGTIPGAMVHTPWKSDQAGKVLDRSYPLPIVDHLSAAKSARDKVWSLRKDASFKKAAQKIVTKHASRQNRPKRKAPSAQLSFFPEN